MRCGLLCCAVQVAGLQPIYMPLGPDLLPRFEDLDPAELKAKRAKVRSIRHDPAELKALRSWQEVLWCFIP